MRKSYLILIVALTAAMLFTPRLSRSRANTSFAQDKLEMFGGHEVAAGRVIVKYKIAKDTAAQLVVDQALGANSDIAVGGSGILTTRATIFGWRN